MKPEFRPGVEWRGVRVPGNFDTQFADLAGYDGLFWYRLEFELPKELAGVECELQLGPIDDESWTWFNGRSAGEVTRQSNPKDYREFPRTHRIAPGVLKSGKNVLVVRCNDICLLGGIPGTQHLRIPQPHARSIPMCRSPRTIRTAAAAGEHRRIRRRPVAVPGGGFSLRRSQRKENRNFSLFCRSVHEKNGKRCYTIAESEFIQGG